MEYRPAPVAGDPDGAGAAGTVAVLLPADLSAGADGGEESPDPGPGPDPEPEVDTNLNIAVQVVGWGPVMQHPVID